MELDNSTLYKMLDVVCEHCGKPILNAPITLWVGDKTAPNGERLAYFCNDDCIFNWWNTPPDNPCASEDYEGSD